MVDVTHNPNYVEEALERLPRQFKEKPFIEAYIIVCFSQLQEVEDIFIDIKNSTRFKDATGVNLDRYGTPLGLKRLTGVSDDDFRKTIITEIIKRASDGTPDKIREVIEATTQATNTRYIEHHPSAVLVYGRVPITEDLIVLKDEARAIKVASTVCTGTSVYGVTHSYDSLWIPCEVSSELSNLHAYTGTLEELVDQNGDNLSVKVIDGFSFSKKSLQGVLPEFGIVDEYFQVDQEISSDILIQDNEDEINEPYFLVGINEGVRRNHGIMLEINQFTINE